jgi:hypothetical protein
VYISDLLRILGSHGPTNGEISVYADDAGYVIRCAGDEKRKSNAVMI